MAVLSPALECGANAVAGRMSYWMSVWLMGACVGGEQGLGSKNKVLGGAERKNDSARANIYIRHS